MQHLYSLAFYLGQNLRQFLHTPKYSSNRSEDHFQDRTVAGTERDKGIELPDNEVYLYNRHQRAGRTGKQDWNINKEIILWYFKISL